MLVNCDTQNVVLPNLLNYSIAYSCHSLVANTISKPVPIIDFV